MTEQDLLMFSLGLLNCISNWVMIIFIIFSDYEKPLEELKDALEKARETMNKCKLDILEKIGGAPSMNLGPL